MDIFQYDFLKIAFLGAVLSGAGTAILSVFISLKRISYMSEAFSHIAFAGIAFALLFGLNMNITTIIFVVMVALSIALISKKYKLEESNITTIFLSVSMAIGIILISLNNKLNVDIAGYLFGNILLITKGDIIYLTILFILNILFVILFFKEIFYICYNETASILYKIPVKKIYYLFIFLLAINIVISVKITGIILITAQLILPGVIALNFIKNVKYAIILAFIVSEISTVLGFWSSYKFDIPTGASIVIVLFIIFLLSVIINKKGMLIPQKNVTFIP